MSGFRYEVEAGILIAGGRFAAFTKLEATVFEAFLEKPGRVLSKTQLLDWVYSLTADDDPDIKIVDVMVCKIRKKLEGMPVSIVTIWGQGYRLVKEG